MGRWRAVNGIADMPSSIASSPSARQPVSLDIGRPVMAKADVQTPDTDWLAVIGRAIQRAVAVAGWSNKEAAAKVGVDDAEFGKWVNGSRRPHLDKLLAIDELRGPLITSLAHVADDSGIVVVEQISIRTRKAG